jgi:preprotein translocase subunit SecB
MAEALSPTNSLSPVPGTAQLSIEKIYIKDLSLENPGSPQSFRMEVSPEVEVGLRTKSEALDVGVYESVLTLTVTARVADKTVFLVEASQAGIFTIAGATDDQLGLVLATHCPTILFPYVRETIADATQRMGYPAIHLAPINFETLYAEQQQAQPQGNGLAAPA